MRQFVKINKQGIVDEVISEFIPEQGVDFEFLEVSPELASRIKKKPRNWRVEKGKLFKQESDNLSEKPELSKRLKRDFTNFAVVEALGQFISTPAFLAFRTQWRVYIRTLVKAVRKGEYDDLPTSPLPAEEVLLRISLDEGWT